MAVRLPRTTAISDDDDLERDRHEFERAKWPDVTWKPLGDEMFDRLCRLGPMVDQWCPMPQGEPAVARILGDAYDMLIEAPELDTDWLAHRLSLDPDGPSWWCRWCPQPRRRPAQYVTGGPDGTVSCATHLPNAVALEHELDPSSTRPTNEPTVHAPTPPTRRPTSR